MSARTRVQLGEDDRFDLVLGTAARERRNRPLALVVIAALVLVVFAVFAVYAIGARAAARRGLVKVLGDEARAEVLIEQWKQLTRTEAESPRQAVGQPGAFKVSKMEDLATRAGMKSKPNTPREIEDKTHLGVVVKRYIYAEVRDPELKALLEWARSGCVEIPGLELESMTLRPEPAGWKLDATFRIWERAGT